MSVVLQLGNEGWSLPSVYCSSVTTKLKNLIIKVHGPSCSSMVNCFIKTMKVSLKREIEDMISEQITEFINVELENKLEQFKGIFTITDDCLPDMSLFSAPNVLWDYLGTEHKTNQGPDNTQPTTGNVTTQPSQEGGNSRNTTEKTTGQMSNPQPWFWSGKFPGYSQQ